MDPDPSSSSLSSGRAEADPDNEVWTVWKTSSKKGLDLKHKLDHCLQADDISLPKTARLIVATAVAKKWIQDLPRLYDLCQRMNTDLTYWDEEEEHEKKEIVALWKELAMSYSNPKLIGESLTKWSKRSRKGRPCIVFVERLSGEGFDAATCERLDALVRAGEVAGGGEFQGALPLRGYEGIMRHRYDMKRVFAESFAKWMRTSDTTKHEFRVARSPVPSHLDFYDPPKYHEGKLPLRDRMMFAQFVRTFEGPGGLPRRDVVEPFLEDLEKDFGPNLRKEIEKYLSEKMDLGDNNV